MNIDMNQMRLFKLIYETQSLTEAAKRFPMSLSSACRLLKQMREEVGNELFVRYGHHLVPTDFSKDVAKDIERILDQLTGLKDHMRSPQKLKKVFTVAGLDHDLFGYVAPVLEELKKIAPDVQVNFLQLGHNFYNDLRCGRCDFVIYPTEQKFKGFIRDVMAEDRLVYLTLKGSRFSKIARDGGKIFEDEIMPYVRIQPTIPFFNSENTRMGLFAEDVSSSKYRPQLWSSYAILTALMLKNDEVTFTPYQTAMKLEKFIPLDVLGSPNDIPPYTSCLIWSEQHKDDLSFIWFRSFLLSQIQKNLVSLEKISTVY